MRPNLFLEFVRDAIVKAVLNKFRVRAFVKSAVISFPINARRLAFHGIFSYIFSFSILQPSKS